ncbi:MAG: Zn-ribbon domain-containing OB-fold protein [Deltaproteobacteria bacterium]|nr:Zn-ribbon domain-containing OB-fold protein [Deltaproteobacteria bacterium]
MNHKGGSILVAEFDANFPYYYSAGRYGSYFFKKLKDEKKIMGIRCPKCDRVFVPPRPVCGYCFVKSTDWVDLGDEGTLWGYTVVQFPFLDPLTGLERPIPYGYGFIELKGAATRLQHFVTASDLNKLRIGMKMKAVFREERKGDLTDIVHFKAIE